MGGSRPEGSVGFALLAAPAVLFMVVLLAVPLADFLRRSLSGPEGPLQYYLALLSSEYSRYVFLTTFRIALIAATLAALLGYPVAWLIASVRPRVARVLLLIVLVPFWTSILVRSYGWIVLLGRRGIVNATLEATGVIDAPLALMFNATGVMVGMVQILLPYMVLPILSVMTRLNCEVVLAAESLGARPRQVFLRVLLPLTLPGVGGGFVLVFTLALGFFVTPRLLGGRQDVMVAMLIEEQITRRLAWDEAAASGFLLLLLTLGAFAASVRIFRLNRLLAAELER